MAELLVAPEIGNAAGLLDDFHAEMSREKRGDAPRSRVPRSMPPSASRGAEPPAMTSTLSGAKSP
jgi:hypothetical protein